MHIHPMIIEHPIFGTCVELRDGNRIVVRMTPEKWQRFRHEAEAISQYFYQGRWQVAEEEDGPDFQVYHVTETAHGSASHQAYCGVEATWRVRRPIWTIYDIPPSPATGPDPAAAGEGQLSH